MLHGALYHYSYALEATEAENAKFAQLYMYDHAEATQRRLNFWNELDASVLEELGSMLVTCSPFVATYRQMRDVARSYLAAGREDITLGFSAATNSDTRRYNHPTKQEVAAVFVAQDGAPPARRDLVMWPRKAEVQTLRVDNENEHLDPMTYALLFPKGDLGWHSKLEHSKKGGYKEQKYVKLSAMQFYAYKLMVREPFNPSPHSAGFLFQQYIVDAYCKAESRRLNWLRYNQAELRAENYKGLTDYVKGLDEGNAAHRIGKRIILPSTYAGSPRALKQNYLDAMAIVRKTGKPDYFITMTANPSWIEVTSNLRPGEHAHDRPDLVARVFRLKWKQMLKEILEDHILGVDIAYCWVIEFQKRGLPHGHLLLTVASEDKVKDTDDIDARVCAEYPLDPFGRQQELFKTIHAGMVHGPCGHRNPNAPCMEGGRCTKNFPKDFLNKTEFNEGYFPKYRRRETGKKHLKNGVPFDNRDIVPYNPYLVRRFECHINVEIVGSLKSVKYLYKYLHKGHDRADLSMNSDNDDEISAHLDARYVGPAEACWRIFSCPLHGTSHHIERLAVHLPQMHSCIYEEGKEREACKRGEDHKTNLLAWFALNKETPKFRHILYIDIPQYCVWDSKTTKWVERKRGFNKVIGRLANASPVELERYFLYLLLLNVPGATCWDDLLHVPGAAKSATTFHEAAILRGLVDNEEEYRRALADASELRMPSNLRTFFAHLLLNCGIPSGAFGKLEKGNFFEIKRQASSVFSSRAEHT